MPIPDFLVELRAMVGHHPLWLPGVSAVVRDDAGRVLLVRRTDNGEWATISGILEPGEQPEDGIRREITEETGIVARIERIVDVLAEGPISYPNGDVCSYLNVLYDCRLVEGEARVNDDESSEVGWFALDALPPLAERQRSRIARAFDPPR